MDCYNMSSYVQQPLRAESCVVLVKILNNNIGCRVWLRKAGSKEGREGVDIFP